MQSRAVNTGPAILPARCRCGRLAGRCVRLDRRNLRARSRAASAEKLLWVLENPLHQYLKVKVRTGGTPCGSHFGNLLATAHDVALLDQGARCVGVASDQLVAVVHLDHVAVSWMVFLRHDYTPAAARIGVPVSA